MNTGKLTISYSSEFQSKLDSELPSNYELTLTSDISDMNTTQILNLFKSFLLSCGYCEHSVLSGVMSLVFSDWVDVVQQRKLCEEYGLVMGEDLAERFKQWKEDEMSSQELARELLGSSEVVNA